MKKKKRQKRKKLESKARIRRRLMRLWTERVHEDWGGQCAVCGSTSTPNAHHLENRNVCRALRYDPMNGILLCPSHHKFGKDSAHKGGIWFADWLLKHHPDRFQYVIEHRSDDLNLEDREVLASIEAKLRATEKTNDGTIPEISEIPSPSETPSASDQEPPPPPANPVVELSSTPHEETPSDESHPADHG